MQAKLLSIVLLAILLPAVGAADLPANNLFALDLYQRLAAESPQKNLFFSPYSISTALAMTYTGARSRTATEMAAVLHFDKPQAAVPAEFRSVEQRLAAIGKGGKVKLHTANSLWFQQDYQFRKEFLETGRRLFNAEITGVDFARDTEGARQRINTWVAAKTADKITDLIQSGLLDRETQLVLCNAIYFKGDWTKQFSPKATKPADFFATPERAVQVPMMSQKMAVHFLALDGFTMIELPYQGGELGMVVLLPEARDGLKLLESRMGTSSNSIDGLTAWLAQLDKRDNEVMVQIPRFKLSCDFDMKHTLQTMGMRAAFGPDADFSGMDEKQDLQITAAIHKAVVEVNEQGTEAAAATAVAVATKVGPAHTTIFRADHPFLFLVREKQTGVVLFLGRMMNPAK